MDLETPQKSISGGAKDPLTVIGSERTAVGWMDGWIGSNRSVAEGNEMDRREWEGRTDARVWKRVMWEESHASVTRRTLRLTKGSAGILREEFGVITSGTETPDGLAVAGQSAFVSPR